MRRMSNNRARNGQLSGNISLEYVIFYYCGNKYKLCYVYFPPLLEPWPCTSRAFIILRGEGDYRGCGVLLSYLFSRKIGGEYVCKM